MKSGIELFAAERARQITAENYSTEHDDKHDYGELTEAAALYAECGMVQVRGVTGAEIREAFEDGAPYAEADYAFNALCRRATTLVAFNIEFDFRVMKTNFGRENIADEMDMLTQGCAMRSAQPILQLPGQYGDFKWPNLNQAHQHFFGESFDGAHSALADAAACARIWFEIQKLGVEAE